MGKWSTLLGRELHNLYSSPDIIRRMIKSRKISEHLAHMCEKTDAYILLVKRSEGQSPVG